MVPLPVVVRHELVEGAEQPTFPEEDQTIETLLAYRAHWRGRSKRTIGPTSATIGVADAARRDRAVRRRDSTKAGSPIGWL
jgi:hypothetical protein